MNANSHIDPTRAAARRFIVLDGLRGVAALSVVFIHVGGFPWLRHGYMAVDLFFMLSGFVVGHAYDDALLNGMTVAGFCRRRLVRLYPLILFGSVAGALCCNSIIHPGATFSTGRTLGRLGLSLLVVPDSETGWRDVFPLNGVMWSLFYELVLDLAYAMFSRLLGAWVLVAIMIASLGVMLAIGFPNGVMHYEFLAGAPRATFGFFGGLLLYRLWKAGRLPRVRAGIVAISLCMLVIFAVPSLLEPSLPALAAMALVMPWAVILGVGAPEPTGWRLRLCEVCGRLSYPLYLVHVPAAQALMAMAYWTGLTHDVALKEAAAINLPVRAVLLDLPILAAAWLTLKAYDEPVRRWLGQGLRQKRDRSGAAAELPARTAP